MTAQTTQMATSDRCTAFLHWDDVTLLSSSISLSNGLGTTGVTFFFTIAGVTQFVTAPPSAAVTTLALPTALAVTNVGGQGALTGLTSLGIGVQVDTSVL